MHALRVMEPGLMDEEVGAPFALQIAGFCAHNGGGGGGKPWQNMEFVL